jgi:trimeric autotransporter adhesin
MGRSYINRIKSALGNDMDRSRRQPSRNARFGGLEALESRDLLATFMVTSLRDSGPGSLRAAIIGANRAPGADTIDFQVAGTIQIGRTSLPAITGKATIDGSTAPSFTGAPVVTVDFHRTKGLQFANGADGSILKSLSLVNSSCEGVTLHASHIKVEGTYIGVRADGTTVAGNAGDGVRIKASSHGDVIGCTDPVTTVSYYNTANVGMQPVSGWQGIRGADAPGQYLISGTSNANGILFVGAINGQGTSYSVNYPGASTTSVYGPDNLSNGRVRLVGSYKNADASTSPVVVHGFLFEGATADLPSGGSYRTIDYPGANFNYVHSTMGDLAVGNYDGPTQSGQALGAGQAYIYNVATGTFVTNVVFPGSVSDTAYGIWSNGESKYTICGGFSDQSVNNFDDQNRPIGQAYLVDYDSATGVFSNWKAFSYPNGLIGQTYVTHFEGISSVEKGVYTLSADSVQTGSGNPTQGSLVSVRRKTDGSFGDGVWIDLHYPGTLGITSSNSVYGNQVVGIVIGPAGLVSYQATVNVGFQLSNVISGNGGNGIGIYGANDNVIAMNNIGTDASGTAQLGNRQNGILVTKGAARNIIGGQATGANDPTANVFVRPPQGNLISGNRANGVLINNRATQNLLSGNFVGTTASGNSTLGNRLDGVAVDHANGNQLIGCTFRQAPFVFYNVLGGNGQNGLRVTNSNDTTVQANFMGAGANNATIVANGGDGLLISGSSKNTQVGGVIPLGNVIAGNDQNGIEVRDTASGFTSFNTFAGIFAFAGAAPNKRDGILITSSGGDNLIRTCIVSGNLGNGIELGGDATGVQVTDTAVGTNTSIKSPIPNGGSGIVISGRAHDNAIGGFQHSVEPQVTISSNDGNGIAVIGSAHDNLVFNTFIGTDFAGVHSLPNMLDGIYLGPGTSSTTIGGSSPSAPTKVFSSLGNGVTIRSSRGNMIVGAQIASNQGYGLYASGLCDGTVVRDDVIVVNVKGNVNLTNSRGMVYAPRA